MKVTRNFDRIYSNEADPWSIGNADSARYDLYYNLVLQRAKGRKKILDIGSGFGSFLARFKGQFDRCVGIELSSYAIEKGKQRFPFIEFIQGSAYRLDKLIPDNETFDVVMCSDVIYYLNEHGRNQMLGWIADHLAPAGIAFIAAWCPGGHYLEFNELERLVKKHLRVDHTQFLESHHALFVGQQKKMLIAITLDYETWHPIPVGKTINWERDVILPTDQLLQVCSEEAVKMTVMAEMGEFFWLREYRPEIARRMEEQWKSVIRQGHDVQLHLHPCWLPELGARYEHGEWYWDWSKASAQDYPGDLRELIHRCKSTLESVLRSENSQYSVTCFRAGAYQAQPFARLYEALSANGLYCDSSVYSGGFSTGRGYDYRFAYSNHQPYFANRYDPQLKAPPSEHAVVELPVFTYKPDQRWFLDESEGLRFADRLMKYNLEKRWVSTEAYRRRKVLRKYGGALYALLKPFRRPLNILLPKGLANHITTYEPEMLVRDEYFVMIGHSKANLHLDAIRRNIRTLKQIGRFEFVTLSSLVERARTELLVTLRQNADEERQYQVKRETGAILSEERNEAQSHFLQEMIPLDRSSIVDLGCGAGYWSARIASLLPRATIIGIDAGEEFIAKAKSVYASDRVRFQVADFARLTMGDESHDCVYADNSLEHAFDVDATLKEVFRVLRWGGVLVAALPSDARNPEKICDNHTWKTVPHEVRMRLKDAGFSQIEIEEVDTFRTFGMPPYPPSNDQMMFIRAWKRSPDFDPVERAREITTWVYGHLNPERPSQGTDAREILRHGFAFCLGYAIVLGTMLKQEGYRVQWLSMIAHGHPRGTGKHLRDSHEVVLVDINGKQHIFDAMANTYIPNSLDELLKNPGLAKPKEHPDERYRTRQYHMYDSEIWYSRVVKYKIRNYPAERVLFWKSNKPAKLHG